MTTGKKVRFEDLFPIIEETVKKGNSFSFCAYGKSMLPFIRDGKDIVTLSPIEKDLLKNDIIFYRRDNGQFVLHRIVKICDDESLCLCGDNQYCVETGISKSQVIAKLSRLERDGKEIRLESPFSRLWCFFLPLRRFYIHVKRAIIVRTAKLFK